MDENGEYPDWIELYNPTSENIDISGYVVNKTGDLKKEKYTIPDGTVLGPASFYLFDPGFGVSSKGCIINLLDREKNYIDNIEVPHLLYDTCYARKDDGAADWGVKSPTPGYSNADGSDITPVVEGSVSASRQSGFYDDEFDLELASSVFGREVYYTVDGSDPRVAGKLYDAPVRVRDRSNEANVWSVIPEMSLYYMEGETSLPSYPVDKCTVIRAVAKDYFGRFTDIDTYVYYVGYGKRDAYNDMTVVSLTADPDDLFSHEDGIFVLGRDYDEYVESGEPEEYEPSSANFARRGRKSEREVNVEIFDQGHRLILNRKAGLRIKGLSSRWEVQKSMSVIFRQAYGDSRKEKFTTDETEFDLHSFALEKCGQDTGTKMTDVIMDRCMSDTGCATKKSVPCCVFLNGEYWGFYWLAERLDGSCLADKYGVDKDDVLILDGEKDFVDSGWEPEIFDMDSLLEYYAGNIIVAHEGDWPEYNVRFWKTGTDEGTFYGDGKLRPVIFDMNSKSMLSAEHDSTETLMQWYPFYNLSEDEGFRKDLVAKIDEMCADEFEQKKVLKLIDELHDRIKAQMILDKMRYSDCSREEAEKSFDENVDVIREFFMERYGYLDKYREEYLNGK